MTQKVERRQLNQKLTHDKSSVSRDFQEGEEVYARNFSTHGSRWLSGHITKLPGPVSVEVKLEDGSKARQHFDQIRKKPVSPSPVDSKHKPVESEDPCFCIISTREHSSTFRGQQSSNWQNYR